MVSHAFTLADYDKVRGMLRAGSDRLQLRPQSTRIGEADLGVGLAGCFA
jgi:hypothetical protein